MWTKLMFEKCNDIRRSANVVSALHQAWGRCDAVLIDASNHSLAVVTERRKTLNTARSDAEMFAVADDGR